MDYYSLKRKQLQALCKQHNIPANSANSVLAQNLSQLLNEKQKPTTLQRTCLKSPIETAGEGEPAVSKKEAKKVRFSPNNDLLVYELRSGKTNKDVVIERKGRRKSVVDKQAVNDNNNTVDVIVDAAQNPVRLTRSRVQVSGKDGVISNNQKKQGKNAAKDVEKVTDVVGNEPGGNNAKVTRSKRHTLNKSDVVQFDETKQGKKEIKDVEKANESVEGTVVGRVRVTRSKPQSFTEDGIGSDVNPRLKKRSGKDAHIVDSSMEITDIPVRVTRTRGQILRQDNGNMVTNSHCEKKRTRKEMKSTDLRINSSNVDPHDNQELPRRKSLRTRGVETLDEDESEKLGRGKQKKRNKESVAEVPESQHHDDKGPRQSRRNVAKVEDSKVLNQILSKVEIVNDKKVTRSKHRRESKLVQQPEEPVDHGEKKVVNRRKRESLKETVMVESPTRETRKSVGKTQSKEQFGNPSLIDESLEDIENVTRSGKDASENEIKAVVNPIGSPKSRKRRGTPIVEDQTVETEYVSPADESPRHSALGYSKSEAKKQLESSLKKTASRKNNQLHIQYAVPEVNKENSSKKRAKFSGTNQRYSENHSEKKGTQISKLGNIELEEVTEVESTPVIESHRRITRSAIRTGGKEPSQSAIKEQPIGDAQFSSRKVARFRTDPVVNTAPGRVTRSGIKLRENAAIIFSEKVDKRKQLSQSAHRKQPFDDTQISLPEAAEVRLNPDVDTIGVQSEISKASESVKLPTIVLEENMVMENLSPVTMAEKPEVYETTPDAVSDGSHVQNETQEVSVKSTIYSEAEVQVALNSEKPMADKNEMDLTKLGSTSKGLQIDLMAEEPAISVDKTVEMEENEAGFSAISHVSVEQSDVKGTSKELEDQIDPSVIENVMQTVEDDGSYAPSAKGSMQDDLTCKDSFQNDSVDKDEVADNGEGDDEDESVGVQKPLMNKPVSEDRHVADGVDALKIDESVNKEDVITTGQSVNEGHVLPTGKSVINCLAMESSGVEFEVVPSTNNDVHEVPIIGEYDGKEEIVSAGQSVAEHGEMSTGAHEIPILGESSNKVDMVTAAQSEAKHGELSTGKNVVYAFSLDRSVVTADDRVDAGNVPTKKLEFEIVLSTGNDVHEVPILGKSYCEDEGANVTKEGEIDSMPLTDDNMLDNLVMSGSDGDGGGANAIDCDTDSLPSTGNDIREVPILGKSDGEDEGANVTKEGEIDLMPLTDGGILEDPEMSGGNDDGGANAIDSDTDLSSNDGDDGGTNAMDCNTDSLPSTGNDVHEVPILGKSDGEDEGANVTKEGETDSMPLTDGNMLEDLVMSGSDGDNGNMFEDSSSSDGDDGGANAIDRDTDSLPSTGNDVHEVPILGKYDGENEGEIDSMPLTDGNMLEDPVMSGSDGDGDGDGANAIDWDTDLLPSTVGNKFEDSLLRGNDGEDGSVDATDCQIDSLPLSSGNVIEHPVLSGNDSKAESNAKPIADHDVSDTSFLGKNDYNINRQLEPTLEPSPADVIIESRLSNCEIYDDVEVHLGNDVPKELETALEPANAPVSINDVSSDFENDRLTSNDSCAMDDHNVGGENAEPAPNENSPAVTEVSIRSCDQEPDQVCNIAADEVPCDTVRISASVGPFDSSTNIEAPHTRAIAAITVDRLEKSVLDINNEAVSNNLGDTYDTDTKNDCGNELKFCELGGSFQPKESESFPPDMSKEQTSVKAEMTTGIVLEEHTVATVDLGLDGGKFVEDCSNHGVGGLDAEFLGILNSDENSTSEENPPLLQTKERKDSDSPTLLNEDDRDKQRSTSVDWGDYSFKMDEFHNSVAENKSDDALDKRRKASCLVSKFQISVGASSSSEENSRVAADMVNSVKNLEMASRSVDNEKSSQDVDMTKENVNAVLTDEVFNWPDSSLKSLLKTPAGKQVSHVDVQEGVGFPSQDHYSSLKYIFETPATSRIGDVKYDQDDAVDISNQDHCLSLTPATARISLVKDACSFIFPDDVCNRDIAKNGTSPHEFNHSWESLEDFDGETQGNATTHISENVTNESIEDCSRKFFGDHSSDDGKDKHFELKGGQVDQSKQFDLSSEVGTNRHHTSGLENSIYSDEPKKKEETQLKGRAFDD